MAAMTDHDRIILTSEHTSAEHVDPACAHARIITVPDFEALFADYKGSQPQEDEFAKSVGREH